MESLKSVSDAMHLLPVFKSTDIDFENVELVDLHKNDEQLATIDYFDKREQCKTLLLGKCGNTLFPMVSVSQGENLKLDPESEVSRELNEVLAKADEFFGSDKIKNKLFGVNANKYEYRPLIKKSDDLFEQKSNEGTSSSDSIIGLKFIFLNLSMDKSINSLSPKIYKVGLFILGIYKEPKFKKEKCPTGEIIFRASDFIIKTPAIKVQKKPISVPKNSPIEDNKKFVKIPLDTDNSTVFEFQNMLEKIDEYFSSDANKKKIFERALKNE
jgi:hypothetical protein